MLLTVHARAEHTLSDRPRFTDPAAVELVSRLDYDFTIAGQDRLMADGVVLRTLTLDPLVAGYLATHPGCTVVNIACGLDTRFQRLDDGHVTWYDLDLPDAELVTIPGAAHGFGDANWEEAMRRTIDFLAWNGVLEED